MASFAGDMCLWLLFVEEGNVSFSCMSRLFLTPFLAASARFLLLFCYLLCALGAGLLGVS